jgi:hypothetical protein
MLPDNVAAFAHILVPINKHLQDYTLCSTQAPFSAQVAGGAIIQEVFQDHFQNLSRQSNLLNHDDLTIFMPTTVLCAVRRWQRLRENCEGQDRHISFQESKAAISSFPIGKREIMGT